MKIENLEIPEDVPGIIKIVMDEASSTDEMEQIVAQMLELMENTTTNVAGVFCTREEMDITVERISEIQFLQMFKKHISPQFQGLDIDDAIRYFEVRASFDREQELKKTVLYFQEENKRLKEALEDKPCLNESNS